MSSREQSHIYWVIISAVFFQPLITCIQLFDFTFKCEFRTQRRSIFPPDCSAEMRKSSEIFQKIPERSEIRSNLAILPQTSMQIDWMTLLPQIDEKLPQDQINEVFQIIKQFLIAFTHSNCSLMQWIKNIVRPLFCSSQLCYHTKENSHTRGAESPFVCPP
jgi:hypothetical protein